MPWDSSPEQGATPVLVVRLGLYAMEAWLPVATLAFLVASGFYIYDGLGPSDAKNAWLSVLLGAGFTSLGSAFHLVLRGRDMLKGRLRRLYEDQRVAFCVIVFLFSPLASFIVWAHSFAIAVNTSTATVGVDGGGADDSEGAPNTIATGLDSPFTTKQVDLAGPTMDATKPHAAATDAVRRAPHAARVDVIAAGEPAWLFWYTRKLFATAHATGSRELVQTQGVLLIVMSLSVVAVDTLQTGISRPATVAMLMVGLAIIAGSCARACRGPHADSAVAAFIVAFFALLAAVLGVVGVVREMTGSYHVGTKRLLFGSATFGMSFPALLYAVSWAALWLPMAAGVMAVMLHTLWNMDSESTLVKVLITVFGSPFLLGFGLAYGFVARGLALYVAAASVCQGTFGRPHKPSRIPYDNVIQEPMVHAGPWRLCAAFLRAAPDARSFRRRVTFLLATWYADEGGGAALIEGARYDDDCDKVVSVFVREHIVGDFPGHDAGATGAATLAPSWTVTRLAHRTIIRRAALLMPGLDQLLHVAPTLIAPVVLVCDGAYACAIAYDAAVERLPGSAGDDGIEKRMEDPQALLACIVACLLPLALVAIAVRLRHIRSDVATASILCANKITYDQLLDIICRYHRVPVADAFCAAGAVALTGQQRVCAGVPPEVLEGSVAPFLEWPGGDPAAAAAASPDAAPFEEDVGTTTATAGSDGEEHRNADAPSPSVSATNVWAAAVLHKLTTVQVEALKDLRGPA
jgi:hypothetical protein